MNIRVLLFAQLRVQAGASQLHLDLADGADVAAALDTLGAAHPALAALLPSCMTAVELDYVGQSHQLHDGDELALIPPVQGG